jgi:hypothetical protein
MTPRPIDPFRDDARLCAMIGATWVDVPEFGYAPVLAWWPTQADMPDDQFHRRVLLTPNDGVFQLPIDFSPAVFVGDA